MNKGGPSRIVVRPGETLRLRFAVWIHAEPADREPAIDAAYEAYRKLASAATR